MIHLPAFLAANPAARLHGPAFAEAFDSFCYDSRIIQPGQLFVAYRTDKGDGHAFIEAACRGGAAGVVCQEERDLASFGVTCVVVPDCQQAMERYAAHVVCSSGLRIVGVTGSAGKTGAKEMLAHVLAGHLRVFKSPKNYNGYFGLPIALGYLDPEVDVAVLEMGIDRFGEMALMAGIAPPEVAVVTVVAPAHLAIFGSIEAIAREKGELVAALPAQGLAVLNLDDPRVAAMAGRTAARAVFYGAAPGADYRMEDVRLTRGGTEFVLVAGDRRVPARLPWLGAHYARTALAAVAVAAHFGMSLEAAVARLASLAPNPGRLNPIPGRAGSLILDDSYNASPDAVLAGLAVLAELGAARRIAVLGDMAELGEMSDEAHRTAGRRAAEVVDVLVTRGKSAALIAEGARAAGLDPARIAVTYTAEDAIAATLPYLGTGDIATTLPHLDTGDVAAARPHRDIGAIALVKGSAVARMEQVVAGLMAAPERAPELLVRQDAAWRQIVVLQPDRPTWVEIDLGAIAGNARILERLAAPAAVMAVLKADAYGHGAVQVAHTALRNGARACGVACLSEGLALRQAGIDAPILVLGYTPAWQAREAIRAGLAVTLFDQDTAAAFSQAAQAVDRPARVHVKVDTGMRRLGLDPGAVPAFLAALRDLPGIEVDGLFTHTACADDLSPDGRAATEAQLAAFRGLLDKLDASGLRPPCVHAANSAVLLGYPDARFDLVRPGIALYGLAPSAEVDTAALGLRPALAWKTQVGQVRDLAPGDAVGYGHTWRAERPSRVATIPVGYADGFRRAPRTWRHVLVRGAPAPVVGRVSMDQTTIDVTDIPGVRQGDEVVLIGRQGERAISAETGGEWLGTINYEVVAAILARVPRVS